MQTTDALPKSASPLSPSRFWGAFRVGSRWGLVALLILLVVSFYVSGLHHYFTWAEVRNQLDAWKAQANVNLPLAMGLFFLLYVGITALPIPVAALMTMVAGALFGPWLGTALVSVASTLGATLSFLIGRYILRDWVQRTFGDRLGPINRGVQRDGAYYLFTLRVIPAIPFFLVNLSMGLTPIRTTTFAVVSWLGMLLSTFLYVNAGTELAKAESPAGLLSWKVLGILVLLGTLPWVVRKLLRNSRSPGQEV